MKTMITGKYLMKLIMLNFYTMAVNFYVVTPPSSAIFRFVNIKMTS
jgi:hypothetical protein